MGHVQGDREANLSALVWSPIVTPDSYVLAFAAQTHVTLLKLQPYTGSAQPHIVDMGAVRKTVTCAIFSVDGTWLHVGTTSGEIVTVNALRGATQLTHTVMNSGVTTLRMHLGRVCPASTV